MNAAGPVLDCEVLRRFMLPIAERLLVEMGRFFPFGAAMRPDGSCASVPVQETTQILEALAGVMWENAQRGEFIATARAYDARVQDGDAIVLLMDHRDDYSSVIIQPYTLAGGKLMLGEPFTYAGEGQIFSPHNPRASASS